MPASEIIAYATGGLLSYLLGAAPFGLLAGLVLKGIDIRQRGSRNIGATNALRVLGRPIGIAVHALDIGKGFAASFGFARLFAAGRPEVVSALGIAYGLAAILGHVFPVYLGFRGGKGMATSLGVFLGLAWLPTLIAGAAWLLVKTVTRYVSVASMTAVSVVPIAMAVFPPWRKAELIGFAIVVALLVIVRHKSNIVRLLHGTEHKAGQSAGPATDGEARDS